MRLHLVPSLGIAQPGAGGQIAAQGFPKDSGAQDHAAISARTSPARAPGKAPHQMATRLTVSVPGLDPPSF